MTLSNPNPTTKKTSYHHGDLASELLQAAEIELTENGIESFSLRAVAKRAGVSHGAPAHHFKDKTGLLTALATVGYERLVSAQDARKDAVGSDPAKQLVASGQGYVDFAEEYPRLFRLMFSSATPDRSNKNFHDASMLAFNSLVEGVRNLLGVSPYEDPAAMRQLMTSWSMVHGLAELIISGRAEVPIMYSHLSRKEKDDVVAEIVRRALN